MSEIQTLAETENLPLASEVITWPKENTLCLPRFVAPCKLDEDVLTVTASLPDPVLSDDDCDSHLQCDIYPPSTNNPSNTEDTAVCIPTVKGVVFPEFPKSREGLLELRAQLSMELLWVKQAIASRQEVSVVLIVVVITYSLSLSLSVFGLQEATHSKHIIILSTNCDSFKLYMTLLCYSNIPFVV